MSTSSTLGSRSGGLQPLAYVCTRRLCGRKRVLWLFILAIATMVTYKGALVDQHIWDNRFHASGARENESHCSKLPKQSMQLDTKNITVWSNDFHITTIGNVKHLLTPKGVHFIDKSLSLACHATKTCATDLKVLTSQNGVHPNAATRTRFVEAYMKDVQFATVDVVMCFHPAAMCELFMPFNKRLFVIVTTRYEMGRHASKEWRLWNENLRCISSDPRNLVAANNLYDAKYVEYFTGILPKVLPSIVEMPMQYAPNSTDILVPAMHSPNRTALWRTLQLVSSRFVPLKSKYKRYSYHQLCENSAILHLPYQVSIMSLFEQYGMGIPLLVPAPTFLWQLHDQYDLVTERTWERVRKRRAWERPRKKGQRPARSLLRGVNASIPDPNNDRDKHAFLHWIQFADFYQWPHIIQFVSWKHLSSLIQTTNWHQVSQRMLRENQKMKRRVEDQWTAILAS
jgi:hypothetical protein